MLSIAEEKWKQTATIRLSSPLYPFMYALRSSETRRQYLKRLRMLFDYQEEEHRLHLSFGLDFNNISLDRSTRQIT
ncbi:MAG: hypothetical protein QN720_08345 [Nitrososphaeraceae archaeon]|nr:hypothetical protein [Nitrososphaeraceae archaeon]